MTFRNNSKIVRGGGTYFDHLKPKDRTKRHRVFTLEFVVFLLIQQSLLDFFFLIKMMLID